MTTENNASWWLELSMISMERCWPFAAQMGLPPPIVAAPAHARAAARAALEGGEALPGGRGGHSPQSSVFAPELAAFSEQLVGAYGENTTAEFFRWLNRSVVEGNLGAALWAWRHLFLRLCRMVTAEDGAAPPALSPQAQERLCETTSRVLRSDEARSLPARLREAANVPLTVWDQHLEQVRLRQGNEYGDWSTVRLVLELVQNVVHINQSYEIWRDGVVHLSDAEQRQLVAWGRHKASAIGIPEAALGNFNDLRWFILG